MKYLVDRITGHDGDAFDVRYRIKIFKLLASDSISQCREAQLYISFPKMATRVTVEIHRIRAGMNH